MATSGVTTFSMTSSQIENAALRKLAVLGDGQSPSATQTTNARQALNAMLKAFMAKGMPLWVISEYDITPTATRTYTIGVSQTVNIPAPLKIVQCLLVNNDTDTATPMEVKTHYDYNLLSALENTGVPTSFWYEPLNQTGVLHVWPTPDTDTIADCEFRIVYQKPFQDMVNDSDTLDFPQWWQEAIIYGLASRLAPEFGVPLPDRQLIKKEAHDALEDALSFGTEEGSLYIQPDWVTMR
jgi:hypothetical protein